MKAEIKLLMPANTLKGKNVVITGGSRGIGYYMAKKFIQEGANVLITGRNLDSLRTAAHEIGCLYRLFDVSDFDHISDFMEEADISMGGINVLVNNAGVSLHERGIQEVTFEQFDKQYDINLKGSYFMSQKFLEIYQRNNRTGGSILFVSSERGQYVDDIPYGLIKSSINSLTQGLAKLLIKDNIRINAIAPGITTTEMTGRNRDNLYSEDYSTGRFYLPEEVAEIASFLVSDVSSCLSGQILYCNNGKSINYRKQ